MSETEYEVQRVECSETECDNSAFILTTRWVTSGQKDYETKIKVVADILRSHYDEGLLLTLLDRNKYRDYITFADFCYLSGDICQVEELSDGRYNVFIPSCMLSVLQGAYYDMTRAVKADMNVSSICSAVSHSVKTSMWDKVTCPMCNIKVENIEGKELPEQHSQSLNASEMYLREIESHEKRPTFS